MVAIEITVEAFEVLDEYMGGTGIDNVSDVIIGMSDAIEDMSRIIREMKAKAFNGHVIPIGQGH